DRSRGGDSQREQPVGIAIGGEEGATRADVQAGAGGIAAAVVVVNGQTAVQRLFSAVRQCEVRIGVDRQHAFRAVAADDAEDALVGSSRLEIDDIVGFNPEDGALGV